MSHLLEADPTTLDLEAITDYPASEVRALMRPDSVLMDPRVLGSMSACAVSFSRGLMRRMTRERWRIETVRWQVSPQGVGGGAYRIESPTHVMTWVFWVNTFDDRSFDGERAIELNWDINGVLLDGEHPDDVIEELRAEVQSGKARYRRCAPVGSLIWGHANRSARVFEHVIDALAAGRQPDRVELDEIGYLVRNIGLEGNGAYRTRSFLSLPPDHPLALPYHAEMLVGYLLRELSVDLVEHLARGRSDAAVTMDVELRRGLGLGNSSGLGLVFYHLAHPRLVSRWLQIREVGLASAKLATPRPDSSQVQEVLDRLAHLRDAAGDDQIDWNVPIDEVSSVMELVAEYAREGTIDGRRPTRAWDALCEAGADRVGVRMQEILHGLLIDLDPLLADRLLQEAVVSEVEDIEPTTTCRELVALLDSEYRWALGVDVDASEEQIYWWYRSLASEEPRRGLRSTKPDDALDLMMNLPEQIQELRSALVSMPADWPVPELLVRRPDLRAITARVQSLRGWEYHTPRANVHGANFRPADMIHLIKGAFFGVDRCFTVAQSLDRWVRGIILGGAPTPQEIARGQGGQWGSRCLP